MGRTQLAFLALVPGAALGLAACAADVESGEEAVDSEAAIVAPNPGLFGTYRGDSKDVGALTVVVLMSDATYHRTVVVPCMQGPCNPMPEDGVYQLWGREGGSYISFYPDDGGAADRFQYAVAGDTIRLRRMTERGACHLHKTLDRAYCGEISDCQLQNLPPGPCNGGAWACTTASETCRYYCRPPM